MEIQVLYKLFLEHPSVQTDTRKLKEGDIFFALKGPAFDGNTFAQKAIEAGAAYAVIDDAHYIRSEKTILVDDVLGTLQELANFHRTQFKIPFLAITGSNGKTTTKELITTVLSQKYKTYATEGNLNNHIGIPLTLLKIGADAEIAVIEMGANHQKEIEGYCKIAAPTHGLITNVGKAHIEGFGGLEGVKKGKGELYDFLRTANGTIFRNSDLDYLQEMAKGITNQVTYGISNAQYIGRELLNDTFLKIASLSAGAETIIETRLVGSYNFPNVMAAVAVGLHFGISIDLINNAISGYNPDNSRSQWIKRGSNNIIVDAYNANPSSMQAALMNFATSELKNKIVWLGGMKEMGADEQKEHAALISLIEEYNWKDVILVGKEFYPVHNNHLWFETSVDAAAYIKNNAPQNSSILIKGSRGSKMELLLEALPVS